MAASGDDASGPFTVPRSDWIAGLWMPAIPAAGVSLLVVGVALGDDALETIGLACFVVAYVVSGLSSLAAVRAGRESAADVRPGDQLLLSRFAVVVFGSIFATIGAVLGSIVLTVARWSQPTDVLTNVATGAAIGAAIGFGAVLALASLAALRRIVRRAVAPAPGTPRPPDVSVRVTRGEVVGRALASAAAGVVVSMSAVAAVRGRPLLYGVAACATVLVLCGIHRARAARRDSPLRHPS